jgi:predicted ferric reductase
MWMANVGRLSGYAVPHQAAASGFIVRRLAAWTFWLVVAVNAGVVVWLWLSGGGVSAVHGTGDLWTSIGRVTGLLSAYSALIQVLLLARIPWIERLAGFDTLTVWHRRNGKLCLYLVLAHVVFITIGYAGMDRISIPSEISTLLSSYPGMIAATVGTGLFIVVVISSLVIVRRKLPYQAWYVVHLTAYAAIALAWFHQIPTGNELAVNATAAAYWTSLYLATLGLMIVFRLLHPILAALWYRLQVAEVIEEVPNVVSLRITGKHLDRLLVQPGQFFLWRFLTPTRWWESHPFSVSAAPDGRSLRITVKDLGNFSRRLAVIRPGTRIIAEGPFGVFTSAIRRRDRVVLIAGGIGITPIRALVEELTGDVVVLYRVLHEDELIFRAELERLSHERGIRVISVVGDHAAPGGERLMSPEHLRELVPDISDREIFLCGPPAMTRVIERHIRQVDVPRKYIHIERFAL